MSGKDFTIICLLLCLFSGAIGGVMTQFIYQQDLIERGFAEWVANPKTGVIKFTYKLPSLQYAIDNGYKEPKCCGE